MPSPPSDKLPPFPLPHARNTCTHSPPNVSDNLDTQGCLVATIQTGEERIKGRTKKGPKQPTTTVTYQKNFKP